MKLCYCRIEGGNFGDDLNPWLWERLIPELLDEDERTGFYAIGTLLHDRMPREQIKVVFGSGTGYRKAPVPDESWKIYCVRGPLTARALGISPEQAITDPGCLLRRFFPPSPEKLHPVSFMPHHASEGMADWREISRRAGLNYVSPRDPVEKTALAIGGSRLLVTEALHGAIAADSFGVPWIAVRLGSRVLDFKWEDWCRSLAVPYGPLDLPVVLQADLKRSRLLRHALKRGVSACGLGKKKWARLPLAKSTPQELARAAEFLGRIPGSVEPVLSRESRRERLADRLLEQLDRLRRDFRPRRG